MTKNEWLEIGISKGIIDVNDVSSLPFSDVYKQWFLMKMKTIKPQSLDRLECTYNRWFSGHKIRDMPIHLINEQYVYEFINHIIINNNISRKEYLRIYQIINNVIIYAFDMRIIHNCVNFDVVKKYIAYNKMTCDTSFVQIVSISTFDVLYDSVVNKRIYSEKQCSCLLWLLNFYLGLRIGELSSLKFSDFDVKNKLVYVRKTQIKYHNRDALGNRTGTMSYDVENCCKTVNSIREVPLCDSAISIYRLICIEHKNRGYESEYLAYNGKDVVLTRSMDRCLSRLFQLCGIRHCQSHTIRKTVASQLHNANVPTRAISDILGHRELATTEKYYIISQKNSAQYIAYMEEALPKLKRN